MQILTLFLSALAFLMGAAALVLVIHDRNKFWRGNKALRKALVDYVDRKAAETTDGIAAGIKESMDDITGKANKAMNAARIANARVDALKKAIKENKGKIELLEQGCVPDYNEATRAVNAINEMNSGIANIFGFDPLEALQKSRQEGK